MKENISFLARVKSTRKILLRSQLIGCVQSLPRDETCFSPFPTFPHIRLEFDDLSFPSSRYVSLKHFQIPSNETGLSTKIWRARNSTFDLYFRRIFYTKNISFLRKLASPNSFKNLQWQINPEGGARVEFQNTNMVTNYVSHVL